MSTDLRGRGGPRKTAPRSSSIRALRAGLRTGEAGTAFPPGSSHAGARPLAVRLVVEFAIPGAPTDTIELKILEDSIHLTAPAKDVEYVSALALSWPVKPVKAEATYEHGLLRIEVPFKDPMEDAVKVSITATGPDSKAKKTESS